MLYNKIIILNETNDIEGLKKYLAAEYSHLFN
jgi:hypothetical protein